MIIRSIQTVRSGQTVLTQIHTVCHSVCTFWTHCSMVLRHSSNFRIITAILECLSLSAFYGILNKVAKIWRKVSSWCESHKYIHFLTVETICGASSEFVCSSIPSWQILTAHTQPFRGARDLAFCLKVPLEPLLEWASSRGSGETARMRRLAWTFPARIGNKYQIRLTRPI